MLILSSEMGWRNAGRASRIVVVEAAARDVARGGPGACT